jgi:hypothetical protein
MIRRYIGRVSVNNKPILPITVSAIEGFLTENISVIESYNYAAWVGGSCAYDLASASDLDLYLTGEIADITKLEDLLHILYQSVFENYGFMLDVRWCSGLESVVDWNGPIPADIKFIQIQQGGYIDDENNVHRSFCVEPNINIKKISEWLVQGTWDHDKFRLKPKALAYWNTHKTLPKLPAREFLNSLG